MRNTINRRGFLGALLGATAATLIEPRRAFVQVPTQLVRPSTSEVLKYSGTGISPVEGQPGLFRDNRTGDIINIRDFRESEMFDTVVIPEWRRIEGRTNRHGQELDFVHVLFKST